MKITVRAYAKINLLLDIIGKRRDGYHELFMIMQSIGLFDTVTVSEAAGNKISITCDREGIPLDERNIAWRAADEFFKATHKNNTGIDIDIVKRIPHAAGLAGGSADGAAVIVALNKMYNTNLSNKELCDIGIKIGADVPFCIIGGTQLCQGIGEIMHPLKQLPSCNIVIAKPDCSVNTKSAYEQSDKGMKTHQPDCLAMLKAIQSGNLAEISKRCENVFEQFIEVPQRIKIKSIMRSNNALGVCMSGSGPTVYGIFECKADADNAANELCGAAKDIAVTRPVNTGCNAVITD